MLEQHYFLTTTDRRTSSRLTLRERVNILFVEQGNSSIICSLIKNRFTARASCGLVAQLLPSVSSR